MIQTELKSILQLKTTAPVEWEKDTSGAFPEIYTALAKNLNVCSKRGLSERFDSTIGAGGVLMPFGGKYQMTPVQAMVQKVPVLNGETTTCSLMSWGFNPYISRKKPLSWSLSCSS